MIVSTSRWKVHVSCRGSDPNTADAIEKIVQIRDTGVALSHQWGLIIVVVGQQGAHTFRVVTEGEIIGNDESGEGVESSGSSEETEIPK
jgi:hypothetical protein